jgi:DNA-binding winged helix-turn-helix (wHTH) protein
MVTKQTLLESVWGDNIPDSNSFKVHLHNLRKIVDVPFDTPMIQTLPGQGFAIKEQHDEVSPQS